MKLLLAVAFIVLFAALVFVIATFPPARDRRVRRRARVIMRALRRGSFEDWMDKHQ